MKSHRQLFELQNDPDQALSGEQPKSKDYDDTKSVQKRDRWQRAGLDLREILQGQLTDDRGPYDVLGGKGGGRA